jgi:hypothetical protein
MTAHANDIFIVGPARSGTSWLQTMLAEHPDIASPPETHLFTNYLAPLADTWAQDRARVAAALGERGTQVGHGLATVVTDDEFIALVQSFYATVRALVLSAKPGARRLLEKTPDHAVCLDTIQRISPEALIVYLVRDPRDTVRSLLEAGDETWGDWAPTSVQDATTLWLRNVQPWFPRKRDPRITLVRYEDLRSDPAELERIATFLGLGPTESWLQTAIDAPPQARSSTVVRGDAAAHMLNPYGATGFSYHDRGERRQLSRYESAYITTRCRAEMKVLGYPLDVGPVPARLRAELYARAARAKARSMWRRASGGASEAAR